MAAIVDAFAHAWRKYVVDGVSATGEHEPKKDDIRPIGALIEAELAATAAAAASAAVLRYPTLARYFLGRGQSNFMGHLSATTASGELQETNPFVKVWNATLGAFVVAGPRDANWPYRVPAGGGGVFVGNQAFYAKMDEIQRVTGEWIYCNGHGIGGEPILSWSNTGNPGWSGYYGKHINAWSDPELVAFGLTEVAGVYIQHGEADKNGTEGATPIAGAGSKNVYLTRELAIRANEIALMPGMSERTVHIFAQISSLSTAKDRNDAINALGERLPDVYRVVSAASIPMEPDLIHVSGDGQVQLGRAAALSYLGGPSTPRNLTGEIRGAIEFTIGTDEIAIFQPDRTSGYIRLSDNGGSAIAAQAYYRALSSPVMRTAGDVGALTDLSASATAVGDIASGRTGLSSNADGLIRVINRVTGPRTMRIGFF